MAFYRNVEVLEMIEYLRKHPDTPVSIERLAKKFYIHPTTLRRNVRTLCAEYWDIYVEHNPTSFYSVSPERYPLMLRNLKKSKKGAK